MARIKGATMTHKRRKKMLILGMATAGLTFTIISTIITKAC